MKLREYKISGTGWISVLNYFTKEWIPLVQLAPDQLAEIEKGLKEIGLDG